ncbi:MAG: TM0106 family RecB-like putative nuclease [Candidatus Eremiobacteraeota bacterium]|nr:TM0106 family RecB-like putative nuclease [Candidatus Eremiobacteraeota bacterium]
MQRIDGQWIYSATDLNNYLECRRLPELELLVALGKLTKPEADDEQVQLIRDKGQAHEDAYLETLRARYGAADVVEIERPAYSIDAYRKAETATLEAMRSGAQVIYQAKFFDGTFLGHADFLRRVEAPSALGAYSYEAVDTKLALSTKPYFIMQLCNYSEHLERLQNHMPKYGRIVHGDGKSTDYDLSAYFAYYRYAKSRFIEFLAAKQNPDIEAPAIFPLKCDHCSVCTWSDACAQERTNADHLSLVAWMRRDQTRKLERHGISTMAQLARPDASPPGEMNAESFASLAKQAALQVRSREEQRPIFELLRQDIRSGFGLLPPPDDGDVYFDMEGDPLYEPRRGLEYLFGSWLPNEPQKFLAFWGLDPREEKRAFEAFVDFVVERRRRYPALHVYHYANYEKAALSRLAQQHSTRIDELDDLLRGEVFVDLYAVVRQSMMIGEDSYSIKRLERFYGMLRNTEVKKGDDSIVMFEKWRLSGDAGLLKEIELYNEDDCRSTWLLHRWLLERRSEAIDAFGDIPHRPLKLAEAPCHEPSFEGCGDCRKRDKKQRDEAKRSDDERRLLADIETPETEEAYRAMSPWLRSRYLLGHLLSYHRREEKPGWWEYFYRCGNVDTLQERDKEALGGLALVEGCEPFKRNSRDKKLVYTYRYPDQSHKMDAGMDAVDPHSEGSVGIVEIDEDDRIAKIKISAEHGPSLTAVIPGRPLSQDAMQTALVRIADAVLHDRLEDEFPATAHLLEACVPRTTLAPGMLLQPTNVNAASVYAIAASLDSSYLFIQGPPGSGKSTVASHVISELLIAGKRIGIVSTSHAAAQNLLHKVETRMEHCNETFTGLYKHTGEANEYRSRLDRPFVASIDDNAAFERDDYDLAGGTPWLFSRAELVGHFDYLFIDEAGQMSLANALAVSLCARNLVLLGDPSQLAQVGKGTHAAHADDSALAHLLQGHATVPPQRGVFLDHSYRMHPDICRFVSDMMYESRLMPGPGTQHQRITSARLNGSGLRYVPVDHQGNGSSSDEEAEWIVNEIALLRQGTFTDINGQTRAMRDDDIIVVTPYNAQRRLIARKLKSAGINVRAGTVDKFQGQEAAVVFYSMATSSDDDMPRDPGFLFDANRFNVAISRARAMTILVCSPQLLGLQCRTTEQMALVNLLCSYVERAQTPSDAPQNDPAAYAERR